MPESVWSYPRPPRLELSSRLVRVVFAGQDIAQSTRAYRVLETSHPPSWYIPRGHADMQYLLPSAKSSFCEWKGVAHYWSVRVGDQVVPNAAWSYESPSPSFTPIKQCLAFYPDLLECFVDQERVQPQPGRFYGGWITQDVTGPYKGMAGTEGW